MKVWCLPAVLAVMMALGPMVAAGQSVEEVVEAFRRGCLDQLPDFDGSEAALERLGFVVNGRLLESVAHGENMFAGMGLLAENDCFVAAKMLPDAVVTPMVGDLIADVTGDQFRHEGFEKSGDRYETFTWRMDTFQTLVILTPSANGMRLISISTWEVE